MVILRHRLPGGWLRSIEDRFQGPEISVAHDLAERLFDLQERGCRPARRHPGTPAANPAGAIANPGMRIVYDVAGGQTTMQGAWNIEPIDGEAFLQSFQQRRRSLGIVLLQPTGDLAELGHAILLVHLPSRAHQRRSLSLLLARKSPEHIAKLVISTPLHRSLGAEHGVNRRAQSFRAIDDE